MTSIHVTRKKLAFGDGGGGGAIIYLSLVFDVWCFQDIRQKKRKRGVSIDLSHGKSVFREVGTSRFLRMFQRRVFLSFCCSHQEICCDFECIHLNVNLFISA